MRVFVTGASGFVGAHLIQVLLRAGCEAAILATPDDTLWRLSLVRDQLTIFEGYLADVERLRSDLDTFRPEICVHLAWYAEPGQYLYSPRNLNSLNDSLGLMDVLAKCGCRRVIMVGTCAEYDTDYGYLREDTPTRPTTIYAASKLSMSILGQQLARDAGMEFVWARLFYLYGPMEDHRRMIPSVIQSLLQNQPFEATEGAQVRDYLHVEDVASALWHVAQSSLTGCINISSGIPVTVGEIMKLIETITDKQQLLKFGALPYRLWEPMFICGDNRKLAELTGWTAKYRLDEGLKQTITWWSDKLRA